MNSKFWIIVLSGFLIVLIIGGVIVYNILTFTATELAENPTENTEQAVRQAPDFKVYTDSGEEVYFSSLDGKPVLIYTWATWNNQCETELPYFENAWKKYGDKVHFMMINLTEGKYETVDKAKEYVKEQGYTFPVYYDKELNIQSFAYNVLDVPLTVLVDENSLVKEQWVDPVSEEQLFAKIDRLIGE